MKFCYFSYETCHHHLFQANCGGGGWGAEASNKSFDENWIFSIFIWNASFHWVNQFHFFIRKSLSTESVLTQSRRGKSFFPSLVVLVTWYIFSITVEDFLSLLIVFTLGVVFFSYENYISFM